MSEKLTLLPCPACGNATPDRAQGMFCHFIACENCGFSLRRPECENMDIIKAWNTLPRALVWTKEPPKVIGWYFWRSDTFQGNGYEATIYIADVSEFLEQLKARTHENVMFAGPILTPQEPTS